MNSLSENFDLLKFHIEIANSDKCVTDESIEHLDIFKTQLNKFEISSILSEPDDSRSAILNIHPGAGGKESEDWAFMLFRMYKRWADINNFKLKILNYQDGDENGIKDVSLEIDGDNVYGNFLTTNLKPISCSFPLLAKSVTSVPLVSPYNLVTLLLQGSAKLSFT